MGAAIHLARFTINMAWAMEFVKIATKTKGRRRQMQKILIAFDCDGTLIKDGATSSADMVENPRVVSLLMALATMKNTKIYIWSGAGKEWAMEVGHTLHLQKYVDGYYGKNMIGRDDDGHPMFMPDFTPDIAIDDIQSCELGKINIIVREK